MNLATNKIQLIDCLSLEFRYSHIHHSKCQSACFYAFIIVKECLNYLFLYYCTLALILYFFIWCDLYIFYFMISKYIFIFPI